LKYQFSPIGEINESEEQDFIFLMDILKTIEFDRIFKRIKCDVKKRVEWYLKYVI
jgi:hypothetical protein